MRLTDVAKRRVADRQYREGYALGQQWGERLRPYAAPLIWYVRHRRRQQRRRRDG